jgi:ABC-type multidrug transport system fused ATPase/permease subunit
VRRYRQLFAIYLRNQRRSVVLLAALLLTASGLQLTGPQLIRTFIDDAFAGSPTSRLTMLAGIFIAISLGAQAATVGTAYVSERVGWAATNLLRVDLFTHALHLDMEFHHRHTPGEMIERVDGDVTALSQFFTQFILRVLGSGLVLVGVIVLLWWQDWRLGLAIGGYVAVAGLLLSRLGTLAVPALTSDREATAEMYGVIEERLAGVDDIRANRGGDYVMSRVAESAAIMLRRALRARAHTASVWTLATLVFAVGYLVLLSTGAALLLAEEITIGTLYLVFNYAQVLQRPLEQLADQLRQLQAAGAAVVRVDELFSFQPTIADRALEDQGDASSRTPSPLEGEGWGEGSPSNRTAADARASDGDLFIRLEPRPDGWNVAGPAAPIHPGSSTADEPSVHPEPVEGRGSGAASVEFDHVSFAYDPTEPVVADFSLRLEPGIVLGVLGRTGSGKTTLLRLLTRLYEPQSGTIRLDGVPIEALPFATLRRRVGVVTQEVQLFESTVRDNLTLFDRSVPDERIHEALTALNLERWFARLPCGLDTRLGADGAGLSAGEAQLLAFTRVFLRDPSVIVLDEASSRLDPVTETLLDDAIGRLLAGRTAIVIAHRLGTVDRAGSILILEDGRIREFGPRDALAADPRSRFAELLRGGATEVLA